MKTGFFRKTAWNNIKKNYRFYIPRIISETGLLGCFYIAVTLMMDERLAKVKGGDYIPTLMVIGVVVLALLSTILMFYTNSFLMKQRKHEFGLYNVLGMEKKHVGKILFHESFISGAVSIVCGLGLGMLFYKLCSLLICRLLKSSVIIGFYFIKPTTIALAGAFFVLLDVIIYIVNCISIGRMKPVELLSSRQTGEKEPKVRWLMLIVGVVTLAAGYYISITTESPLEALLLFFVAVILVIIGTYFLFVTGTTFVLKVLKKNKKYYYNKRHMPAVSGLLYRMKQNAVGLASIAVLATGVLVMVSTTVSLYSGIQGTIDKNYPSELYLNAYYDVEGEEPGGKSRVECIPHEELEKFVRSAAENNGVAVKSVESDEFLLVSFYYLDGRLFGRNEYEGNVDLNRLMNFVFITDESYGKITGETLGLTGREMATCRMASKANDLFEMTGDVRIGGDIYNVVKVIPSFPVKVQTAIVSGINTYGIVVADRTALDEINASQHASYGRNAAELSERISVKFENRDKAAEAGNVIHDEIISQLHDYADQHSSDGKLYYTFDSFWDARESIVGMHGTLLFLGILLGAVSLFATVLIIYYKQISEGYEDRERFQIMEKIGMSKKEVKKTINGQVLLVFFLPLIVAGIHMVFAYPMLRRMLNVLMLYSNTLFLVCTLITYAVFALVYILIYTGTSRTYYRIVQ